MEMIGREYLYFLFHIPTRGHSTTTWTKFYRISTSLFSIFFLGNMYFKMIANHPTYKQNNVGGDLTLTSCTKCTDAEVLQGKCNEGDATQGTSLENRNIAVGDVDGKPIPMTGW